ncbi:MAG: hypothetical protein KBC73_03520 [Burkholderiaceae bacterium]|nr:hypothetical protein [Burkholderiaceae bacterium]
MASTPDDDPTRALDGFVQRLRTTAPAAPAPAADVLLDLGALNAGLQPEAAAAPPARGGRLRSGQTWSAEDVEDVAAVVRSVSQSAADGAQAAARPDDLAAWQPEPQALMLRPEASPRRLAAWQPGAWIAAVRVLSQASTEFVTTANGPVVETYAEHRLALLWAPPSPSQPRPQRWPQQVLLLPAEAPAMLAALLQAVPGEAPLWLLPDAGHGEGGEVDWALAAEIALHQLPVLRPFQTEALRGFIAAEREATFARLNGGYQAPAADGLPITQR